VLGPGDRAGSAMAGEGDGHATKVDNPNDYAKHIRVRRGDHLTL
jgi:hypothetical protein